MQTIFEPGVVDLSTQELNGDNTRVLLDGKVVDPVARCLPGTNGWVEVPVENYIPGGDLVEHKSGQVILCRRKP